MEALKGISHFIRNRRSVYPQHFTEKEITKEVLDEILINADHAPTHKLTQPWRFKVVSGDKRVELGEFLASKYEELTPLKKYNPEKKEKAYRKCLQSNKILLICMQRDKDERVPEWEEIAATAMAVQNIYLSCSAAEIGCYWSTPKAIEHMHELVSLADGEKCIGLFYMGYYEPGKTWPKSIRTALDGKVSWWE